MAFTIDDIIRMKPAELKELNLYCCAAYVYLRAGEREKAYKTYKEALEKRKTE